MKEKQEEYTIASIKERILFKEFMSHRNDFEVNYVSSYAGNSKFDVIFTSGDTKYLTEIKVRTNPIGKYNTWMIQEDKWLYLTTAAKQHNLQPLYANFHPNGVQMWNLNHLPEPTWDSQLRPINNQYNNPNFISKSTADLLSADASIYYNTYDIYGAGDAARRKYKIHFGK